MFLIKDHPREAGAVPGQRRLRAVFVGRQRALAQIGAAMADPELIGVALVGGEGLGKTRLLAEATRALDRRRYATVRAAATEAARGTPFAALAEDLPPALLDVPLSGYALNAAASALLRTANGRRLVLAIDNVHLIDDASAALAGRLAQRGDAFVLMTSRPGDPLPEPITGLLTGGLTEQIEVSPLTREQVASLLATVLGGPVEGLLVQRFWVATGGNPLLLRELVSAELEAGAMTAETGLWRRQGQLAVPPRLVRLVREKIRPLPADGRHALELLALSEPIGLDALGRLVPMPALETLEASGLIQVGQADGRPCARLVYPLYGEVLRSAMPPLQAQRLRRKLLAAIGDASAPWTDRVRAAVCSLDCGLVPAAESLVAAAWAAWSALDLPSTVRLARQAISIGAGSAVAEPLGYGLMCAGRPGEAEAELAVLPGNEVSHPGLAGVRAINYCLGLGRPADAYSLLRPALAAAGPGRPSARAELAALGALLDSFDGRFGSALEQAARVQADPGRTPVAVARSLVASGLAQVFTDRPAAGATALASARQLAGRPSPEMPWLDIMIEVGLIHACLWQGDLGRARERAAEAYGNAVTNGWPFSIAMFCLIRGLVAGLRGEVGEQVLYCREGIAIATGRGLDAVLPVLLAELAQGHAAAGEQAAAAAALAAADRVPNQPLGLLRPWIERARRWAPGQPASDRIARARQAALAAAAAGGGGFEALALHDLVRLGMPGLAAERLRQLAARPEPGAAELYAAHARAAADHDITGLATVAARLEGLGSPLLAAETAAEQCRWYRSAGRADLASAALARALLLARRCGPAALAPVLELRDELRLTPREREIAALAGQGLSNRDINERLILSIRTIENHLQRVYRKLGIGSRGELAARRPLLLD